MASPDSRPDRAPDPVRQQLREVRRGLFRLHKELIDSERAVFERHRGALSNGQFLQALIQDPFFGWLRPFSGLIVEMDETLADKEPIPAERARSLIDQARELVPTAPEEEEPAGRYDELRRGDPNVLIAHVELTRRINAAAT